MRENYAKNRSVKRRNESQDTIETHIDVCCSIVHDCQAMETTQMPYN
jgi:hypothetical protein